jgi:hypothetical protein
MRVAMKLVVGTLSSVHRGESSQPLTFGAHTCPGSSYLCPVICRTVSQYRQYWLEFPNSFKMEGVSQFSQNGWSFPVLYKPGSVRRVSSSPVKLGKGEASTSDTKAVQEVNSECFKVKEHAYGKRVISLYSIYI